MAVLPVDTRVEALAKRRIAGRDEWFFVRPPNAESCWVYGGPLNRPRYIRLDGGVILTSIDVQPPARRIIFDLLPLQRAAAANGSPGVADEPIVELGPFTRLALIAITVVLFLGSLWFLRKFVWKESPGYVFGGGLCVMTIIGTLSDTVFADLITRLAGVR